MTRAIDVDNEVGQELPEPQYVTAAAFAAVMDEHITAEQQDLLIAVRWASGVHVVRGDGKREVTPGIGVLEEIALHRKPAERKELGWAKDLLYKYYKGMTEWVALNGGLDLHDAEDVAQESWLALLSMNDPPLRVGGFLRVVAQRLAWAKLSERGSRGEIPVSELGLSDGDEDENGEVLTSDIERIESVEEPATTFTNMERRTPEDYATAADLRNMVANIAIAAVGPEKWAIFLAVSQDEQPAWKVAKEFKRSARYVQDVVKDVRTTVASHLRREGYAV